MATAIVLAALLPSCTPHAAARRVRQPGDIQLVAQWSLFAAGAAPGVLASMEAVSRCRRLEALIEGEGGAVYTEGGNAIGRGRCDVLTYTDRVDETVTRLAGLMRQGRLPGDLRIGVAVPGPSPGYRPIYPAGSVRFDP